MPYRRSYRRKVIRYKPYKKYFKKRRFRTKRTYGIKRHIYYKKYK